MENNEKDDSTEILKNIGDVFKIDGNHPQSEEVEEAAIESDADIVMVPPDEDWLMIILSIFGWII